MSVNNPTALGAKNEPYARDYKHLPTVLSVQQSILARFSFSAVSQQGLEIGNQAVAMTSYPISGMVELCGN